jgi:hypothetical protein
MTHPSFLYAPRLLLLMFLISIQKIKSMRNSKKQPIKPMEATS